MCILQGLEFLKDSGSSNAKTSSCTEVFFTDGSRGEKVSLWRFGICRKSGDESEFLSFLKNRMLISSFRVISGFKLRESFLLLLTYFS